MDILTEFLTDWWCKLLNTTHIYVSCEVAAFSGRCGCYGGEGGNHVTNHKPQMSSVFMFRLNFLPFSRHNAVMLWTLSVWRSGKTSRFGLKYPFWSPQSRPQMSAVLLRNIHRCDRKSRRPFGRLVACNDATWAHDGFQLNNNLFWKLNRQFCRLVVTKLQLFRSSLTYSCPFLYLLSLVICR